MAVVSTDLMAPTSTADALAQVTLKEAYRGGGLPLGNLILAAGIACVAWRYVQTATGSVELLLNRSTGGIKMRVAKGC
jgi:hypothetical protein